MSARPPVSRRRFLSLVAAAGAAAMAAPALAAAAAPEPVTRRKPARPPAPKPDPLAKDLAQARESTAATLAVLRKHPLPPGGDLSLVFTPIARRKRAR